MKPKDVVMAALELQEPPRPPVWVWGGGMFAVEQAGTNFEEARTDVKKMVEFNVDVYTRAGLDAVFVGSGFVSFPIEALGGKLKYLGTEAPSIVEPAIKSLDEVDALDLRKVEEHPVVNSVLEAAREVQRQIGDERLVCIVSWGPISLAGRMFGVQEMMIEMIQNPEKVKKLIAFATDMAWVCHRPLLEDGTLKAVAIADAAASGDLISRQFYQEFVVPAMKDLNSRVENAGAHLLLHTCGNMADRLDLIAEEGVSCFTFDTNVPMAEAKKVLAGKVCVAGNVHPTDVMLQKSPTDVEAAARQCIADAAAGGGFVLSTGCDIPPKVPMENVQALSRTAMAVG